MSYKRNIKRSYRRRNSKRSYRRRNSKRSYRRRNKHKRSYRRQNSKRSYRRRNSKRSIDGAKYIKCKITGCSFKTKRQDRLNEHINGVHMGKKPYKCEFPGCEFSTARKDNLTKHNKNHSKPRLPKYNCTFENCNKSFNTKIEIENHIREHPDYKPYKCGLCNFITHGDYILKRHMKDHTGENKINCTFPGCDFYTNRKYTLKEHMKKIHNINGDISFRKDSLEDITFLPFDDISFPDIFETRH